MSRRANLRDLIGGLVVMGLCAAGCAAAVERPSATPEERAVVLETSGCGDASGRRGSGFVAANGVVVTAAHLVVRADEISVAVAGAPSVRAALRHIDLTRDVAVLTIEPNGYSTVRAGPAAAGQTGRIVGGATSGTVPYEIERVVDITIEEVLGTDRANRRGYDLHAATAEGDSGAGVYDDRNRLIGMVFAVSEIDGSTWATATSEIEPVIEDAAAAATSLVCDPERSQVVVP